MNVQELATAVEEALPVKVLLLDNASLGHGPPAAGPVLGRPPDRGRTRRRAPTGSCWRARSAGPCARSAKATRSPDALAETLAEDGPALLHVRIAPEANCLPMFRPGGAAREMIG